MASNDAPSSPPKSKESFKLALRENLQQARVPPVDAVDIYAGAASLPPGIEIDIPGLLC